MLNFLVIVCQFQQILFRNVEMRAKIHLDT